MIIADIFLGFSVVFELSDLLHGVLPDRAFQVHPIKEDPQIADVVVDRANADRFAEVSASVGEVLLLALVVAVERVFPSLLEIVDVVTNDSFCDLIHINNV